MANNVTKTKSEKNQLLLPLFLEPSTKSKEEKMIYLSNALARGSNGLSFKAKKLVLAAIANSVTKRAQDHIKKENETEEETSTPITLRQEAQEGKRGFAIRINALDYADDYGITRQTAYDQLSAAADDLLKSQWSVFLYNNVTKHQRERKCNWVRYAEYAKGEGFVEIAFVPEVAEHLLSLEENFTQFLFSSAAKLKTEYAIALFQNLISWQTKGKWECDIEVFHDAMGTPKSAKGDFSLLRKNIIDPSIKNIQKELGWVITYETKRQGRGGKVIGLVFSFTQPQIIAKKSKPSK